MKRWWLAFGVFVLVLPFAVRAETAANSFVVTTAAGVRAADDGRFHLSSTSPVEVAVEARPGWRVDGRKSVTFTHVPGRANVLRLTSAQGEDDEHVRYEDCWWPSTVTNKHISAPVISAESDEHKLALYAVPSNGATFSVDASVTLVATGVHENVTIWQPCPVCGSVRSPSSESNGFESRVPCGYDWLTEGLGWSFDTATWSAQVKKGSGDIEFFVVGRNDCADCVCEDLASTPVDIVELSVQRPDYLGLDRTDAGRSNSVSCLGAAVLDAGDVGTAAYQWTECGICEFDGGTGDASVTYRNADADLASESLGAEHLTVSVELEDADGCTASATCATNFTVVKVDVTIDSVAEEDEETKGAFVACMEDSGDGTFSTEWVNSLLPVAITVEPDGIPGSETVSIADKSSCLMVKDGDGYVNAAGSYTLDELKAKQFYLHGHAVSTSCRDKEIVVTHAASGAKDKVKFTTYGFRFVTPAGDPEIDPCSGVAFSGRNEFTYDDESSKLVLTLCVAVDPDVDDSVAETLQGRFTLPSIEGAELVWDDDGDGSVNAVEDFNDGYCFGTYAEYQGYPARNEGFGRKTVKFTCGGVTISQDFEVFFPKLGKNHPPCTDCPGCSNWFYYWKLGDVCSIPGNARWAATAGDDGLMGWMDYKLKLIFLTDLAAENEDELDIGQKEITVVRPVYGISTIKDPFGLGGVTSASEGERGYRYEVTESGTSNITINVQSFKIGGKGRGIGCVAAVAAHEQCHLAIRDRLDAQYAVYDAMNELEQIGEIYGIGSKEYAEYELERKRLEFMCADKDQVWGDRVCDGDEIDGYLGLQSDPGNRDTYGMVRISNDYSEYGDNEVRARYVEAQGLESRYHVEKDWSDPGCQHENPYGPLQETEGEK